MSVELLIVFEYQMSSDTSFNVISRCSSRSIMELDHQKMLLAINQTMPFGKHAGQKLLTLPEPYLVWFKQKGFPEGKLGQQLALVYEIKRNGLEKILMPLLSND